MSADTPLRVVIADDDALARRVTRHALRAAGMTVVAEAEDGREAVELGLHHRPDVVLIDAIMPRLDGILATSRILEACPMQLVMVLTECRRGASSGWRRCGPAPSMSCPRTPTSTSWLVRSKRRGDRTRRSRAQPASAAGPSTAERRNSSSAISVPTSGSSDRRSPAGSRCPSGAAAARRTPRRAGARPRSIPPHRAGGSPAGPGRRDGRIHPRHRRRRRRTPCHAGCARPPVRRNALGSRAHSAASSHGCASAR